MPDLETPKFWNSVWDLGLIASLSLVLALRQIQVDCKKMFGRSIPHFLLDGCLHRQSGVPQIFLIEVH